MLTTLIPILLALDAPAEVARHRFRVHAEIQPVRATFSGGEDYGRTRGFSLLHSPQVAFGLGFAPHPMVVLGARLGFDVRASRSDLGLGSWRSRDVAFRIMPYLEVLPLPRARVQPFLAVEGGTGYRRSIDRIDTSFERTQITPGVGGRVGLHAFVLPRLSIDADVGVGHSWSITRPQHGSLGLIALHTTDTNAIAVTGTLGVSGWF